MCLVNTIIYIFLFPFVNQLVNVISQGNFSTVGILIESITPFHNFGF